MPKLIVVGMRFQNANDVKRAEQAFKQGPISILLKIEDNSSGVDGKAVSVWYSGVKVGYIRNKDLPLDNEALYKYFYKVTDMSPNYWVVQGEPGKTFINTSSHTTTLGSGVAVNNPCIGDTLSPSETKNPFKPTKNADEYNKKETKMNISANMRDSFFREVKNVALDFQSGKFGVNSSEGLSVYVDGGVSINPITEFGIKVPAFALRVAVKDLKEGDIVVNGNDFSFFKGLTENGYEVVSLNGEVKQVGNVANLFFGKNSVLAVKNMFGDGAGTMNPMMMAMMLGDGKEFDMKTFAMMSMMGGGQMDTNMMMMFALMGK